jgi:hypothetical protein
MIGVILTSLSHKSMSSAGQVDLASSNPPASSSTRRRINVSPGLTKGGPSNIPSKEAGPSRKTGCPVFEPDWSIQ